MLSKERIVVMTELAMIEEEYGDLLKGGLPRRKSYVRRHLFAFFIWESLLYLLFCLILLIAMYILNAFSMPDISPQLMFGVLVAVYALITYLGLSLVKRRSVGRYRHIKKIMYAYNDGLERLQELYGDETKNV